MKTNVIFKKREDGQIIALFPDDDPLDLHGNITSYMHVGQHSGASPDLLFELESASPEEYKDLKEELESIGYKLKIKE